MSPIRASQRSRYPADWAEITATIKTRAEGRCECLGECERGHQDRCDRRQHEPIPGNPNGSRTVLTTAHLDHQPENCDPQNLKAMCQACHLNYDKAHHAATRRATRLASLMSRLGIDE